MRHPYYLADTTGKLRFTEQGLSELRPYFAGAGIGMALELSKVITGHATGILSPTFWRSH